MRATLAKPAIVALAMLMVSGCRSGGGKSMWPWGKNKGYDSSMEGGSMSGPQLPSSGATTDGTYSDPYNYNAPAAANPYDQTNLGNPPANAYPAPGGYPTGPPAGAYGAPATASAAGTPGYGGDAQAATAAAPQAGPYSQHYAQGAADPYAATASAPAYPTGNATPYAAGSPSAGYPTVSASAAGANPGPVVENPYAAGGATPPDPYANTAPVQSAAAGADPYASAAQPGAYGAPADHGAQAGYPAGNAEVNQQPVDPYATAGSQGAQGAYQPGSTGYTPGNTGYTPPGVAPYQTAAIDTGAGATSERRNPYYRPGSTSDYLPSSNSQATGNPGDRYGAPATATAPGWPQGY
ncbi:MAG: hypothetical protein WD845_03865 [Pirellulales bacterium]